MGRPVSVHAIAPGRTTVPQRETATDGPFGSSITLPLEVDGRPLGRIGVLSAESSGFDDDEVALLTELATDLALGIESARDRAAAAQEMRRFREQAEQTERRRIAATLHDGVAQTLQAINLGLKRLRLLATEGRPPTAEPLDQLIVEVADAIDEVREIGQELRPRFLERLDLHEAIAFHCGELERRSEIPIRCLVEPLPGPIDDRVKVQCFLGFREALGNALKHANATRIDVTMTPGAPGLVTVCIADNGQGFDIPQASNRPSGLGLAMIAERAESVGGCAEIQSLPGEGTRVRITVPLWSEGAAS